MNNIFNNPQMFIKEIKSIWRIILSVMIFQILIGLIFIAIGIYGYWFIDMWFGGVIFTPIGIMIGFFWQNIAVENSWKKHKSIIVLLCLISILMIAMVPMFPLDQMAETLKQKQ